MYSKYNIPYRKTNLNAVSFIKKNFKNVQNDKFSYTYYYLFTQCSFKISRLTI